MPAQPVRPEVEALPLADLIDRYSRGSDRFDRSLLELSDAQLDTAFRPEAGVGRWSCRILLGHIADAELAYTHRMRRAVGEENPVLSVWDENAFIDAGLYGKPGATKGIPIAGHVAMIHTLRLWTADWLRTLAPEDVQRRALHPEYGPITVHHMLVTATFHLEHHAWFLARKLEKLRGAPGA